MDNLITKKDTAYLTELKAADKNISSMIKDAVISNINNNGVYTEKNDTISWQNLSSNADLTYAFSENESDKINFTGVVKQKAELLGTKFCDDNLLQAVFKALNKDDNEPILERKCLNRN